MKAQGPKRREFKWLHNPCQENSDSCIAVSGEERHGYKTHTASVKSNKCSICEEKKPKSVQKKSDENGRKRWHIFGSISTKLQGEWVGFGWQVGTPLPILRVGN